jgi:hypothetical protein
MPRIAELRHIDGHVWTKLEIHTESPITLWTEEEVKQHAHLAVKDFLINLWLDWKEQR